MADLSLRDKQSALLLNVLQSVGVLLFLLFSVVHSNSIIALADCFQEGSDMIAMLFSYIAIRKISEQRNQTYNYGYGKLEAFASLLIAFVMVIALIFVLFNVAKAFSNPVVCPCGTPLGQRLRMTEMKPHTPELSVVGRRSRLATRSAFDVGMGFEQWRGELS